MCADITVVHNIVYSIHMSIYSMSINVSVTIHVDM